MARPIWTGAVTFGLVSVPVAMYSATREHEVSFHQYEKGTTDRIRYQRVNERTGKEVDYGDIAKGTDVGGGKLVMLEQEELDSVAPGRSKSLELHAFVDLEEIDPIFYQKSYYLAPGSEETAKTYALLRDAMAKARRAAIGTLVMRGKEYLAAIRPDGKLLVLETMYFADEVRDPAKELDGLPRAAAKPAEMKMAIQLIDSMSGRWNPKDYRDGYTDRVNALIKEKKAGKEITVADPAPGATDVTDLMAALQASVERARSGRAAARKPAAKKERAKKASPGKASAKKPATGKKTAPRKAAKKAA
ncbi:Ku protein [Actinoplanes sp. NPDC026623]|uniref:non-homologous end joining protein Ku n=1 Tax=Actinoplanes sp. NPDC026623 TaxID=3155610 RepID=UPI00340C9EE3